MAKVEQSIIINAPVEKVYSYVCGPMNQLEWLPSMTDVRDITGEGVGQKFGCTYKMMGISFKGEIEVVESVANQGRIIKSTGDIQSTWTWTFKSENGKTVVNLAIEYTFPVPVLGKVAEQIVLRQNERKAALSMTNIKERLES